MIDVAAGSRLGSVTIDLDAAHHYHAVHALSPPDTDHVVARGLERFLTCMRDVGARGTIFVVTRDLADPAVRALVLQAHGEGHEIASHSHAHAYDLSRQSPAHIEADLARSIDAIVDVTGTKPRGFRAPGYNQSEPLMDALEKLGFAYDSSFLKAPLYFAARAIVLAFMRVRGRASSSLVGEFAESLVDGPFFPRKGTRTQPARSRAEARAILEIPISGVGGVPFIGTTLALLGRGAKAGADLVARAPGPCVLELHAIDFCDADDVDPAFARVQPELRVAREKRERDLRAVIVEVRRTRELLRLDQIADAIAAR